MLSLVVRRFLALMAFILLHVSVFGSAIAIADNSPHSDIEALVQAYIERSMAGDSQALADMYTEPATWIDPTGSRTLNRSEIKRQFDMMYEVVSAIYEMEAHDLNISVDGSAATVRFAWSQVVENAFLGRMRSEGATAWELQWIEGKWYIARAQTEVTPPRL